MRTLSEAMENLVRRGFTEHFGVRGDQLRGFESGKTFGSQDVIIREYERFEGVSDPDDMAIIYALESASGLQWNACRRLWCLLQSGDQRVSGTCPIRRHEPCGQTQPPGRGRPSRENVKIFYSALLFFLVGSLMGVEFIIACLPYRTSRRS